MLKPFANIWEEKDSDTLYYKFDDGMDMYPSSMEYHSNWWWLIETCKELKKISTEWSTNIGYNPMEIETLTLHLKNIHNSFENYNIEEVYLKVVECAEFIVEIKSKK